MESTPAVAAKPKQPLVNRLGFFVLGGVGSAAVNSTILNVTKDHWGWPYVAGYAFSASSTAAIFFLWSYFVNFRTSRVWKNCLGRYLCCFLLALLINYIIGLLGLKQFGSTKLLRFCVIVTVQSFTGGIKFLLYHFWVFPHADPPEGETAQAAT
jgi:putative flippase GtrA